MTRHIWQDYMERAEGVWHSPFGKKTMRCARRPLSASLPVQKKKKHALYAISSFACGYRPGEAQICRDESEKAHNLQAYMENLVYHKTYSGIPQGGIISPLLANIYLHERDKFVMHLTKEEN